MQDNGSHVWQETEAGKALQDRLNSEKTLRSLDHLLQRIDTLEKAVEKLTTLMEQGPGMVSIVADMADDSYRQAADRGIDIDQRLRVALEMAEKLTAPEMVDKLNSLLKFADQAPGMASMIADMADDSYRQAAERGIDIDQRLRAALEIAGKLTAPEMVDKLNSLLKLTDQAPGMVAMAVDMFDEGYKNVLDNGIDIPTLSRQGIKITKSLSKLLDSGEFDALMNSGVFNPKALDVISVISGALIQCRMNPPEKVGIFKILWSLRDPEIKKSLGFLLSFARNFGNLCNQVVERDLQNNKQ